jgi:hypothetical protein
VTAHDFGTLVQVTSSSSFLPSSFGKFLIIFVSSYFSSDKFKFASSVFILSTFRFASDSCPLAAGTSAIRMVSFSAGVCGVGSCGWYRRRR